MAACSCPTVSLSAVWRRVWRRPGVQALRFLSLPYDTMKKHVVSWLVNIPKFMAKYMKDYESMLKYWSIRPRLILDVQRWRRIWNNNVRRSQPSEYNSQTMVDGDLGLCLKTWICPKFTVTLSLKLMNFAEILYIFRQSHNYLRVHLIQILDISSKNRCVISQILSTKTTSSIVQLFSWWNPVFSWLPLVSPFPKMADIWQSEQAL